MAGDKEIKGIKRRPRPPSGSPEGEGSHPDGKNEKRKR